MVRAPCCEKMGLKKGPWSPQEDQILASFIQKHGHGNWRALPKQAGLLRCGKSCRLRWMNYLRPDIKRGNFTKEEEEAIINLHEMLGNRWSAIAARLPGRTDNEIKNVWHTHLKKKLKSHHESSQDSKGHPIMSSVNTKCDDTEVSEKNVVSSPQGCSSEMSSQTDEKMEVKNEEMDYFSSEYFPHIDESFWSEDLCKKDAEIEMEDKIQFQFPLMEIDSGFDDSTDFWYNVFIRAEDRRPDLPEF